MSGLNHTPAKGTIEKSVREFESLTLRQFYTTSTQQPKKPLYLLTFCKFAKPIYNFFQVL